MYQSLLLSMLNIVLHLYVLVHQLNQQKFNPSDMMYSIRVIAEDTDSISTEHCSDANILVHLVILRTRKIPCLQYYEQSIPFATFKYDDVFYLVMLRTRRLVSTILLRTVHSVRYVQNYSFSICTCTTLSYYEQGTYSVVFDIYCFYCEHSIPFATHEYVNSCTQMTCCNPLHAFVY